MMQTERLRQALEVKGREEALLLLVDTILSDVTRANSESDEDRKVQEVPVGVAPPPRRDAQARVRDVVNEYSSAKSRLLEAVSAELLPVGQREKAPAPPEGAAPAHGERATKNRA